MGSSSRRRQLRPGPVAAGPGRSGARSALHGPRSPRSVPARSLSAAGPKTTGRLPNGPDAGRVFIVWGGRGSARRRAGARPRDSKDRSKALRVAPARLPRIATLASDTPHTSTCRQAPKHPGCDASRRRHRSPTNRPRPQENSSTEYFQTPTFECARNSPTRLNAPIGARCLLTPSLLTVRTLMTWS